jgi:hypothetical protein
MTKYLTKYISQLYHQLLFFQLWHKCSLLSVLGGDCNAGGTCPGDLNAECKGDKCVCKTSYAAKNDVCTQSKYDKV